MTSAILVQRSTNWANKPTGSWSMNWVEINLQISHISCNFVSISVEILLKWWPIAMHIYLQQPLMRVVIHRTQVAKKKWKLRVRFSPTKEDRMHQTKISTKTDKGDFSPAVSRSRLEQNFLYWIFSLLRLCFVFYGEIYVKNEYCVRFCRQNIS